MYTTFVGIDISKSSFDVCILDHSKIKPVHFKFKMDSDDFSELSLQLSEYDKQKVLIVMESTGSYHYTLLSFLLLQDFHVSVVNPQLINNFIRSETLRKTKNDKKDAHSIAKYAEKSSPEIEIVTERKLDSLRVVLRERESLSRDNAKLKTEIKAILNYTFPELLTETGIFTQSNLEILRVFPSAKSVRKYNLKKLEKELNKATANKTRIRTELLFELAANSIGIDAEYSEITLISKVDRLLYIIKEIKRFDRIIEEEINKNDNDDHTILSSVDGIGKGTSSAFIAEVGDIDKFASAKQLIAFAGTDPSVKQSGTSVHSNGKITKRGNAHLRRTIWIMAVCVIRCNPYFKTYFQKKSDEGMKYKKAVIATANKLLRVLFALLKNRTHFVCPANA
ncbi:MAG: IS110 family transposase [Candidatus Delongbacteria bacterium]|nr:IS110 family transposase [Candidatus Delongbacteria bacterium]